MNKQYFNVKAAGGGSIPPALPTPPIRLWSPQPDWIDISSVNNNEINLLVREGTGIAFSVATTSGTYSIDWGDGTIETLRVSGTVYQHQHTINGTLCSLGYNTWKIRIYGASTNIKRWKIERHTFTTRTQYPSILWAVFGTQGITDYSYCFYSPTGTINCKILQRCEISSFSACTTVSSMFQGCTDLSSVILPSSWGSLTNLSSLFSSCYALSQVTLPTTWGNITNVSSMFYGCYGLNMVSLPASWGGVTDSNSMFHSCYGLTSITLPASCGSLGSMGNMFYSCYGLSSIAMPISWGSVTNTSQMFGGCYSLSNIVLPASWGSITNVNSMFYGCYGLTSIAIPTNWGSIVNCSSVFQSCYGCIFQP